MGFRSRVNLPRLQPYHPLILQARYLRIFLPKKIEIFLLILQFIVVYGIDQQSSICGKISIDMLGFQQIVPFQPACNIKLWNMPLVQSSEASLEKPHPPA